MRIAYLALLSNILLLSGCATYRESDCITVADFAKGLYHPNRAVRQQSASFISLIGEKALPELEKAMRSDNENTRWAALEALVSINSASIPVFVCALKDNNPRVREMAATGLQRLGPKAAPAVPVLIETLKGKDISVANYAARALGSIGKAAQAAIPALEEAMQSRPPAVAYAAKAALKSIQDSKD